MNQADKQTSQALPILALALLPALIYANTLGNSFHYDDASFILNNSYTHSLSGVKHFFVSSQFISNIPLSGYRPLTMTTFALNYILGGENSMGYHLVNVVIHVLNTLLAYAVSLALMRALEVPRHRYAAFAAALLFACHPINTQPVNYISGRSTLLVGGFSLLCVLLYLRGCDRDSRKALLFIGSLAAYLCALLSKEEAVAVPCLLGAFELCRLRLKLSKGEIWQITLRLMPFAVLTLAFLALVVKILGIVGATAPARGVGENLLTQAKAFFLYLKMIFIPINLSVDHVISVSSSFLEPLTALAVIGVIVVLGGSLLLIRKAPVAPMGVWWFTFVLVPSSTLIALKLVLNEQRLYLAMLGVMFIVGAGLGCVFQWVDTEARRGQRKIVVCVFGVAVVVLSALTVMRNTQWRDPISLWGDALRKYPDSVRANTKVAQIHLKSGNVQAALEPAKKAAELGPDFIEARIVKASVLSELGMLNDALIEARGAVDLNPSSSDAHSVLGTVYVRLKRYAEAEREWQRALKLDPQNSDARANLDRLRGMRGEEFRGER